MTKLNTPSLNGLVPNNGAPFVTKVREASEINIAPALIVNEPLDQTVEFEIDRISIFDPGPVPTPQPFDELDALTMESTIIKELILDVVSEPVPIPAPSRSL
jgi:hypothetical protein